MQGLEECEEILLCCHNLTILLRENGRKMGDFGIGQGLNFFSYCFLDWVPFANKLD